MNILVAKNGSQLGPFSENDIRAKLASGEFSPTDHGWHEGLTAWSPLAQLFGDAAVPPPAPAMPPQPSSFPQAQTPQPYAPQPYGVPQGQNVPGGYAPQPYNSPYPQAYQPGTMPWGVQGAGNYGGFWIRLVAYIIDAILLAIPSSFFSHTLLALGLDPEVIRLLTGFFNLIIFVTYFTLMEGSRSQGSVGKMILGLRVIDEGGGRLGFGAALGRSFGKIVSMITLGIGFIMAGLTQRKQALHDLMAHTLVVRK